MRARERELLEAHHWGGPAPGRLPSGARRDLRHRVRRADVCPARRHHRPAADPGVPGRGRDGAQPHQQGQGRGARSTTSTAPAPGPCCAWCSSPSSSSTRCCSPSTSLQTARRSSRRILPTRCSARWGVARRLRAQRRRLLRARRGACRRRGRCCTAERAALVTARPIAVAGALPAAAARRPRGLIGLANVLLPGKGLKQGPFVSEQELLGIVEAAAEDEVIEHEERELIESSSSSATRWPARSWCPGPTW